MSWWQRFGRAGVATEADAAAMPDAMPPGSMPMIVGVYVGLVLGTMDPPRARRIRGELEAEMGSVMGLPAEQLEAEMRQLVASLTEGGRP